MSYQKDGPSPLRLFERETRYPIPVLTYTLSTVWQEVWNYRDSLSTSDNLNSYLSIQILRVVLRNQDAHYYILDVHWRGVSNE